MEKNTRKHKYYHDDAFYVHERSRIWSRNRSDFDDSRRQAEFGWNSRIQWNEWERGLVTTQTKFNRGLHAGITQDRDLSRGRWANPRRFESSLFAAAYPWIREFSENHAQTPFTISPWISNIENGSRRLSSLHRILAHRYSISIQRSSDGSMDHDYVVFTYVFSRVIRFICFLEGFIPENGKSFSHEIVTNRFSTFSKKISDFWNRRFRPTAINLH